MAGVQGGGGGGAQVPQAETFKRVHPLEYYRRFVGKEVRPDGRKLGQFRGTTVNTGSIATANGSAAVRMGQTSVVCGIKAEFANPPLAASDPAAGARGYLVSNVTLGPLCGAAYRPGPPSSKAQSLSQFLDDVLTRCDVLDLSSLLLVPDKLCWVLYLDVYCLNDGGNLTDACLLAAISALRDVKLPEVHPVKEEGVLPTVGPIAAGAPLTVKHTPVAVTFGLFDRTHLLADPSAEEEALLGASTTVVVDEEGCICLVRKPAPSLAVSEAGDLGAGLSMDRLNACLAKAVTRSELLVELVGKALSAS